MARNRKRRNRRQANSQPTEVKPVQLQTSLNEDSQSLASTSNRFKDVAPKLAEVDLAPSIKQSEHQSNSLDALTTGQDDYIDYLADLRSPLWTLDSDNETQVTVSASIATATSGHEPPTDIEIGPRRTGFQDLPREIKDTIYFMVLRPDCKTDFEDFCGLHHDCIGYTQGRTNLLLLCSEVYTEAVELLHQHENALVLSGKKGSLFRNARDFGRPGKFTYKRRGSTCYIPPRFCELQVLRFRALAVCVVVPVSQWDDPNLVAEVEQLVMTIKKSHHLQTLRILFKRRFHFVHGQSADEEELSIINAGLDSERELVVAMRPLVNAAIELGIKFTAEEDGMYRPGGCTQGGQISFKDDFGDPLVSWLNSLVPMHLCPKFKFSYRMNTDGVQLDDFGDSEVVPFNPPYSGSEKSLFPVERVEEEALRFRAQYNQSRPTVKYQLLPECRSCYSLFSTWQDLKQHLVKVPKHKLPFRNKLWNTIRDDAAYGGSVKCHWCAYQPPSVSSVRWRSTMKSTPGTKLTISFHDGRRITGGMRGRLK